MKNIHVLPTDKPSRFYFNDNDKCFQLCKVDKKSTPLKINQNTYITNDETIKEGDWCIDVIHNTICKRNSDNYRKQYKKIILTTDQDLIKDGVQAINDNFLEWFVKNPSCEEVETFVDTMGCSLENCNGNPCVNYKIIIPKKNFYCGNQVDYDEQCEFQCDGCVDAKGVDYGWISPMQSFKLREEPKREPLSFPPFDKEKADVITKEGRKAIRELHERTLEEAKRAYLNKCVREQRLTGYCDEDFENGAKWHAEQYKKMYSEEEVEDLIYKVCGTVARLQGITLDGNHIVTAYNKFKKK
jgi:hypothetical protein